MADNFIVVSDNPSMPTFQAVAASYLKKFPATELVEKAMNTFSRGCDSDDEKTAIASANHLMNWAQVLTAMSAESDLAAMDHYDANRNQEIYVKVADEVKQALYNNQIAHSRALDESKKNHNLIRPSAGHIAPESDAGEDLG